MPIPLPASAACARRHERHPRPPPGQLSRAAPIAAEAADLSDWQPRQVDAFDTPAFTGFAASDEHAAYLVFRGTKLQLDSGDLLRRTLQAWLANLDFAQVEERGRAWSIAAMPASSTSVERAAARDGARPCRSAASRSTSPATAPAAPWPRWPPAVCTTAGADVRAAVVFSAPRVGDRRFAATYPVPLLRIEHRHDLIPHLPLPPSLARLLGRGVLDPADRGRGLAVAAAVAAPASAGTEYVHAGELLYDDGASTLYRVPPGHYLRRFGPLLRRELQADLLGRGEPPDAAAYRAAACPRWATPVPARLMDGVRLPATLAQIGRQLRRRRLDFLLDHHIDGALAFDRPDRARGRLTPAGASLRAAARSILCLGRRRSCNRQRARAAMPACVSAASPCCAASMPAPARSARWCSAWTARWSPSAAEPTPDARARARQRRARRRGAVAQHRARCCGGSWPSCPTPRRSAASRSPASARPACCSAPMAQPLAPIIAWYDTRTTGELEWLLADGRLRAAAPHHRSVRRPDLQPAQAALVPAPAARAVRRGAGVAQRRRLSRLAAVRRAGDRLQPRLAHPAARPRAAAAGRTRSWRRPSCRAALLPPIRPSGSRHRHRSGPRSPPRPACRRTASSASAVTTMSAA